MSNKRPLVETSLTDPIALVSARLGPWLSQRAGGGDIDAVVRPSDHADAQINGALPLAKQLGCNPRDLATEIVDSGQLADLCSDTEVAGPGFINVTFSNSVINSLLTEVANDEHLGLRQASNARTVVVDYSAPNVAKEMHVGHLRSTVIGDALVRMYTAAGHRVIRENHIGDWGRPFGMLIEHLLDLGEEVAASGLGQGDLDSFYKAANAKFSESEEFQERSRQRVVLLQGGDEETHVLWN